MQCAGGEVSKNLVNSFSRAAWACPIRSRARENVGVLGVGTMGGIAFVGADNGINVKMKDINNDAAARAFRPRAKFMKISAQAGDEYDVAEKMSHHRRYELSGFQSLDVVIEAIVENMEVKESHRRNLQTMPRGCDHRHEYVLLSVTEMAEAHAPGELCRYAL